jgi:hypothetical protein
LQLVADAITAHPCTRAGRRDAPRPLLLCVKPGLTGDGPDSFEANLASLGVTEGVDYLHFS